MYDHLYQKFMTGNGELPFVMPAWLACAPFEEFLSMHITEAANGKAVLTMPFQVKHAQGMGLMHGGAITALADTAVAMAIKSILPESSHFATIELTVAFHAPVKGGVVTAKACVGERDERTIKGSAEIYDENGVKTATFTSVFKVKKTGNHAA